MSYTESTMLELGTTIPDFNLPEVSSAIDLSVSDCLGPNGTVIMFMCNHCPYVLHVIDTVVEIADKYMDRGIGWAGISSNDAVKYPADGPDEMLLFAREHQLPFPYLYDESQSIAHAYHAACTPEFYVFDEHNRLVYRGRLDGSRPGNDIPCTGEDLRRALDHLLVGKPIDEKQYPGGGCGIKWKTTT